MLAEDPATGRDLAVRLDRAGCPYADGPATPAPSLWRPGRSRTETAIGATISASTFLVSRSSTSATCLVVFHVGLGEDKLADILVQGGLVFHFVDGLHEPVSERGNDTPIRRRRLLNLSGGVSCLAGRGNEPSGSNWTSAALAGTSANEKRRAQPVIPRNRFMVCPPASCSPTVVLLLPPTRLAQPRIGPVQIISRSGVTRKSSMLIKRSLLMTAPTLYRDQRSHAPRATPPTRRSGRSSAILAMGYFEYDFRDVWCAPGVPITASPETGPCMANLLCKPGLAREAKPGGSLPDKDHRPDGGGLQLDQPTRYGAGEEQRAPSRVGGRGARLLRRVRQFGRRWESPRRRWCTPQHSNLILPSSTSGSTNMD